MSENSSLRPMTRKTSLALEAQLNRGATLAILAGIAALLATRRTGRNVRRRTVY
jgi:hypothetical protein